VDEFMICARAVMKKCSVESVNLLLLLCTGQMVYAVRERCGRQLAVEASVEADIVSTVPDSATPAAMGYSQQVTLGCLVWSPFKFNLSFMLIRCVIAANLKYTP